MADAKDDTKAQPEQAEPTAQPEATADTSLEAQSTEPQDEAALVEQLQSELDKAQAAIAEAEDQVLRAKADAQNMRRRAEQDVEKARKFALERFSEELLPVADSLERTIEASPADDAAVTALREGAEMTLNMFMATLKKFNVEQLDPQGEPFDPQLHQAMSMVENADVEPNTVLHVMQKGYRLNGRLVRPAMVMVSKSSQPTQPTPKIDEQA